jgi:uncharacterized membrane protein
MTVRERLLGVDDYLYAVMVTLAAAGLRLYRLGHQSIWSDEGFSIAVSSAPLDVARDALLTDVVHPPFYYLLLRLWLFLGNHEIALRLLSAMLGILTIPLFYALCLRLTRRRGVSLFAHLVFPRNTYVCFVWLPWCCRNVCLRPCI